MALLELKYKSEALGMETSVNVILPELSKIPEQGYKTLYLYHGLSNDQHSWIRYSSIERYAAHHGIAVVMPSVGRSWYADMLNGQKYFTFVTEELPAVCRGYFRGMSARREDTYVAGLSMGGYGAVKAALLCPEMFCGCASLSGALDITRRGRIMSEAMLQEWKCIFGVHPSELEGTRNDLITAADELAAAGKPFPKLNFWCGTEDMLIASNRVYHAHLEKLQVPHRYVESEGDHSWRWWDLHIQDALRYLLEDAE